MKETKTGESMIKIGEYASLPVLIPLRTLNKLTVEAPDDYLKMLGEFVDIIEDPVELLKNSGDVCLAKRGLPNGSMIRLKKRKTSHWELIEYRTNYPL